MDILADDTSAMVYRRVKSEDVGEHSLDGLTLNVLMELDGQKNLGIVAEKTDRSMKNVSRSISKLLEFGLIEPATQTSPELNKNFFQHLIKDLTFAIGPIAPVLIDDALVDLECTANRFPVSRAAELIDRLARLIDHEEKRNSFKKNMFGRIRKAS